MSVSPESVGITSKYGQEPQEGTQRILYSRDPGLMAAFNQNVTALRELQVVCRELLQRVDKLKGKP
jgi:hypothetical protein